MSESKKRKQLTRGEKIVSYVVLSIVGVIIIFGAISIINPANGKITMSAAEKVCQQEAIVKTQSEGVKVVSLSNYNPQFYDTNNTADDGTSIKTLTWNGKSQNGENSPAFVCNVSGTNNNVKIESLQYGADKLL